MRLHLVRHATLIVEAAGRRLLIDPQLDPPDLPEPAEVVVQGVDALVVTRYDRLDATALRLLPRDVQVACHATDEDALLRHGFQGVGALGDVVSTGRGFVVAFPGEPRLYLVGDAGFSEECRSALDRHRPHVVVADAADPDGVVAIARHAPAARLVAVLEAHGPQIRADLHQRLHEEDLVERVSVPEDGSEVPL